MTHHPTDDAAAVVRSMRVAAVPSDDPYVAAVLPPDAVLVGPPGTPSPWLSAEYLTAHADEVDVLHLHDHPTGLSAPELECWTETVRRLGIPLVLTVHQLREPACPADGSHEAALAALLATAEVVLTLTPGAADEITERFGRTPIVVAHPSVAVPVPDLGGERGLVGLVLHGSSRADRDLSALVRAALSGAIDGGGRLRVLADADADADHADADHADAALRRLVAEHGVELVLPEAAGREGWVAELQRLHVAVLPERCRTHSRDLEICRDVGTRVVAPSCGWFADQWSEVVSYTDDDRSGFDPVSLTTAVAVALTRPAPRPADAAWRTEQRAAVRRVHAEVYARVAADRVRV